MTKKAFENKVLDWIRTNGLFDGKRFVLLAVSGGADSVAMVHALYRLQKNDKLNCNFVIGHVNHCLRGDESDADEMFVKQLGQTLGIDVVSQRVDVKQYATEHKLSIETAGRELRLKALAQMAEQNNCNVISTAHHKDDLAETMIHRLMRGTGFRGLCGTLPASEVYGAEFVRPMLGLRRNEIVEYCNNNSIIWQEDASNQNTDFTRNKIRHNFLPVLEDESGTIVNTLENLSLKCRRFQLSTEKLAKNSIHKGQFDLETGCFSIDQDYLEDCSTWVFYEVMREVLVKLGVGLRRYTREHFTEARRLIDTKQGRLTLPENLTVQVSDDGQLVFSKMIQIGQREPRSCYESDSVQLVSGGTVRFGLWEIASRVFECSQVSFEEFVKTKDPNVEWLDANKIAGHIQIRSRKDGDRFWPIGATTQKKVGRFLIDAQLDKETKEEAFIVEDGEKILWVAPIRMCEQAKVSSQTKRIFEIRVDRKLENLSKERYNH